MKKTTLILLSFAFALSGMCSGMSSSLLTYSHTKPSIKAAASSAKSNLTYDSIIQIYRNSDPTALTSSSLYVVTTHGTQKNQEIASYLINLYSMNGAYDSLDISDPFILIFGLVHAVAEGNA